MVAYACAFAALVGVATPVSAEAERSFALRVGRILPVSPDLPWEIESGVIVVRDGRIVAIGSDVEVPPDLKVIDLPDATIMPGLVSAATDLAQEHTGDESVAAAYIAVDTFRPYGDYKMALSGGVTTGHLSPGNHRLVTGQGAVVKLGGDSADRVLLDRSDLTINLGEAAFDPPNDVTYTTPASSDLAIPPAVPQRPTSRLGQYLALNSSISDALGGVAPRFHSPHPAALAAAWRGGRKLRIQAQRGADLSGAVAFINAHERAGYLVGAAEADLAAAEIRRFDIPVVYRMGAPLTHLGQNIGDDPDALEADLNALASLSGLSVAIAPARGDSVSSLRLAAAVARRSGLDGKQLVAAITSVPARILGVADRVGSLAPGMDADLLVLSGDPLATSTHVHRVYIGGAVVFAAPDTNALVVRAGTIWINEEERIDDGAILIEDGRIAAVGRTVPHPPFARYVDAGDDAFVTPGFIDALGHLGLDGDTGSLNPSMSLTKIIGVPGVSELRVARAGVTTVLLSPYSSAAGGSQVAAVKTAGGDREARVVRAAAGVAFNLAGVDPMDVGKKLQGRLAAGRKYLEKWQKYEKELAEWKEKQAKGEAVNGEPKSEESTEEGEGGDPITGTWSVTISGGPIPEPQTATMKLKLTGDDIEGRIIIPGAPEEAKIVAKLDGTHISGEIQIDAGDMGYPQLEADIVEEDHIVGVISIEDIEIDLDAERTDKASVEFKVVKRRSRGKGGRPLPPKVDEGLEPVRAILEQEIPAVVRVDSAAQVDAVLGLLEAFDVPMVLVDAREASTLSEKLVEKSVGVIVPTEVTRWRNDKTYHQADDLSRKGIDVAFKSEAEDGARTLPDLALHAVERGMSPDAALAALTVEASRMFKLDDEIGSLDVGRHGDLVIFSGHPFEAGSRVMRVIVGGEEVR